MKTTLQCTSSLPSQLFRSPQPLSVQPVMQEFAARTVLPAAVNFWQIEAGFGRTVTWLEDGTVVVLGIWGTGDVVGRSLSARHPYQIECLTKVEVIPILQPELQQSEAVLLKQLQCTQELMLIRGCKRVDTMLLKLLAWLADRFGETTQKGRVVDMRLTHQDLADLLGATRVTVTRVLSQLEQQGYIERLALQRIVLRHEEVWHYQI